METLIDSGVLTWDISGLILMTPENGSILIDALKVLEPQWKNPLVNFKKNMSNYLFKMAPDRGRLMYTNPYYNREFRHNDQKMELYIRKVKDRMRTENMKKRKRHESPTKAKISSNADTPRYKDAKLLLELSEPKSNQPQTHSNTSISRSDFDAAMKSAASSSSSKQIDLPPHLQNIFSKQQL